MFRHRFIFLFLLMALCSTAFSPPSVLKSYAQGFWGDSQSSPVYQTLPDIENQLYGHAYLNQSLGQRVSRVEKTLFGSAVFGPLEPRMEHIKARMQERHSKASQNAQEPMITYLEEKLFQRAFPEKPLGERMTQLESQVFGRPFEHYPLPIRIKKLTYAMPLMAKEIRLTRGDTIIARANGGSARTARTGSVYEDVQLKAQRVTQKPAESLKSHSSDDYYASIHRNVNGSTLRWSKLPIQVFIKPPQEDGRLTQKAVQAWQGGFSVTVTNQQPQADVIVSWDKADWDQNPSTLLTRPIVRMSDGSSIRTVVMVTLYPIRNLPPDQALHVISHQLGHAFGLWGHSDDPSDVMYPALKWEVNDFPTRWRWRSESAQAQPPGVTYGAQPSPRDINTLLRVYDQPASDLSAYTP